MSQVASQNHNFRQDARSATPTETQRAVCKFLMTHAPVNHDACLTRYTISGAPSGKYWVLSGNVRGSRQSFITLSLPELSNKVFLGVSDRCQDTFEQLVSSFNAKSECNDALTAGYAELVKSPKLNRYGWGGVLIMEAHRILKKVPQVASISGEPFEFLLLVPITVEEYMIWRNAGYAALLQHFSKKNRSIFHFYQEKDDFNRLIPVKVQPSENKPTGINPVKAPAESVKRVVDQQASCQQASRKQASRQQMRAGAPKPARKVEDATLVQRRPQAAALAQVAKRAGASAAVMSADKGQALPPRMSPEAPLHSTRQSTRQSTSQPTSQPTRTSAVTSSVQAQTKVPLRKAQPTVAVSAQQLPPQPKIPGEIKGTKASPQAIKAGTHTRDAKPRFATSEPTLAELSQIKAATRKGLKRAVGESAVGTVLLVGGFVTTLSYVGSESPAMGIMPAVFTVAGLLTLASAFNDALTAGQQPQMS